MGNTTALKVICSAGSVQEYLADGLCFMQFGQDATLQKFRAEICRCVKKFGGKGKAKEMKDAESLENVVSQAADWLEDRAVLLVCDDLWAMDDNELGCVPELKNMF